MSDKTVLVVDDEEDVRQFLADILDDEGYLVRLAKDGNVAWEMMIEDPPDLVLLDLLMPHGTGTGLFRKMHDRKELKGVPVIVVSGLAGRRVAVSRGVPVFDKPIDEARLRTAIHEILDDAA